MDKKRKIQIAISLGIICTILTTAIMVQLKTIDEATQIVGTTYAEEGLKDEVLKWKESYEAIYSELESAEAELEAIRQEATQENDKAAELEEELSTVNKLLGLTELTGSGVIVTLSDNDTVSASEVLDISNYIVHDEDIMQIINELKNAGAEAISVNGERIVSTTSITCSGTVIMINGVKLNSPFVISAIGNPESLSSISRPGGYLEWLEEETGVTTSVEKSTSVTVAKYSGIISSKYMETVEE